MSWFPLTLIVGFFVLAPWVLGAWVGLREPTSRLHWGVKCVVIVSFMLALWHTAGWHIVGTPFRWVGLAATVVSIVWSARRLPDLDWWSDQLWPTGVVVIGLFALSVFLSVRAGRLIASGRLSEGAVAVDLAFPFQEGSYYVVSGGTEPVGNPHMKVLTSDEWPDYTGQGYALDLVRLNRWGMRASGLSPMDRRAYAIYGTPVHAPCSGPVVGARGDLPDYDPPDQDLDQKAGNYVVVACGDARVVLAHLKQGSLEVSEGDEVETGDLLAEIGNSGKTSEPHLHIHAQTPAEQGFFMSGRPRHVRFDGEFLSQTDVVEAQ